MTKKIEKITLLVQIMTIVTIVCGLSFFAIGNTDQSLGFYILEMFLLISSPIVIALIFSEASKKHTIKYAMVTINFKSTKYNQYEVRRVLISYKRKKVAHVSNINVVTYVGTKFIDADEYFTSNNKSHKYRFKDSGYELYCITPLFDPEKTLLVNEKRAYHYFQYPNPENPHYIKALNPIEFTQLEGEEYKAIFRFRERKEKIK